VSTRATSQSTTTDVQAGVSNNGGALGGPRGSAKGCNAGAFRQSLSPLIAPEENSAGKLVTGEGLGHEERRGILLQVLRPNNAGTEI